jgi:hypothetical protein
VLYSLLAFKVVLIFYSWAKYQQWKKLTGLLDEEDEKNK